MISKVELNRNGTNYLQKGDKITILSKSSSKTKIKVHKENGVPLSFYVANDLVSLWFK